MTTLFYNVVNVVKTTESKGAHVDGRVRPINGWKLYGTETTTFPVLSVDFVEGDRSVLLKIQSNGEGGVRLNSENLGYLKAILESATEALG